MVPTQKEAKQTRPWQSPEDSTGADPRERYSDVLHRLSEKSVEKHFGAYQDVDWDSPELHLDPQDPRWARGEEDFLGATEWFQSQPQRLQTLLGLAIHVQHFKVGLIFENVLKRGLIEYASTLEQNSPEFRYIYHEIIEECHHSLMFQEFINRSGLNPRGLNRVESWGAEWSARTARWFPELFFVGVLGGEAPIDYQQRRVMDGGEDVHPLLKRIMKIHVIEEARHLHYAHRFLEQNVPKLSWFRRKVLIVISPFMLAGSALMMLNPAWGPARAFGIPYAVIREAYSKNPKHRLRVSTAFKSVRELFIRLGLMTPLGTRCWKLSGLG